MASGEEILTVGHSNHEEGPFIDLLRGAGVELLVDVRVNPRSRYEHFNRSALAGSLKEAGIDYEHLGEQLGGRREPGRGLAEPGLGGRGWFRGYADHMASEEFAEGLRTPATSSPRASATAVMCAEADWTASATGA